MILLRFRRAEKRAGETPLYIDTMVTTRDTASVTTVAFVLRVTNRVGLLKDLTEVFQIHRLNIVKLITPEPAYADKPEAHVVVIAETTDKSLIKKVEYAIKKVSGVKEVKTIVGEERILFPRLFPIMVNDERAVLVPQTAFHSMLETRDKFGITLAMVLNRVSYTLGEGLYEMLVRYYGEPVDEVDYDTLSKAFIYTLEALGWGKVSIVTNNAGNGEVVFRIFDNIECLKYRREGKRRGYMTQAVIEGFYRKLWSPHRVKVRETKCIAAGDPYCEFNVSVTL